jgi:molybdenum cofactor cytidylyltransferase
MAAVILAAGRSSRMGESKPLLSLGSASVIERLVGAVAQAKVDDIVVVTGHQPGRLAAVLDGLPVRRVHNAGYDAGMFSSIRTGVAALRDDVPGFFIVPADYPLVRPEVLHRLSHALGREGGGILHPTCCGRRGHPPLLSGLYRDALLRADDGDDLRRLLQRHAADETEIEVEDLTILMDMDTPEDHQRMGRFAGFLDAAAGALPTPDDALYLLALLGVPDQVVRHSRAVAKVGEALVEALRPRLPDLDIHLVRAACLLHDLARARPKHALVAEHMLRNLGLARLGAVVGAHMVLPSESLGSSGVTEEHLVYLADKLVVEDAIGSLAERAARALRQHGHESEAAEGARTRMRTAEMIRDRVEALVERPLEEVLARKR